MPSEGPLMPQCKTQPNWVIVPPVGGSTHRGVGASRDETAWWLYESGLPHYVDGLGPWPLFPPRWLACQEGNQAAYVIYIPLDISPATTSLVISGPTS